MKFDFNKIKSSFGTKSFRAGGYSLLAIALVIVIVVLVNIFVNALPSTVTKLDITANQMYSLSEASIKKAESVEDEITIYWLVRTGQEDEKISILLDRYTSLNKKISVKTIDPDVYPTFYKNYTDDYNENSLIVENGSRYKYVDYYDIYEYSYEYSSYSYYGYTTTVSFDGENEITSAIDYVINENLPTMYTLTGHGESELSSDYESGVSSENVLIEELSLLTLEKVPEDASVLLINNPQSDISDEEYDKILTYLTDGGSLVLITSPLESGETLDNVEKLMSRYGLVLNEGIVIEGDQNYYAWNRPFYIVPDLSTHSITYDLYSNGYYTLLPLAQGITITDTSIATEVMTTSDSAFSKIAGYSMSTYSKEDGDIDGPFALAVAVEDGDTKIFWCTSPGLLDDSTNQMVSGGNMDTFLNAVNWACGESEESLSIRSKSLSSSQLTLTSADVSVITSIIMVIIPLLFVGTGLVIWIRRRHK